jgi:hypothetical protein
MEEPIDLPNVIAATDFVIARSQFLDRFADLEAGISAALQKAGTPPNLKEPFGHRLKAFKEIEKVSVIAKCRIGQRNDLVEAISKILPIRADIVHSRMQVSALEGVPVALFVNSQFAADPDAPVRLLTLERLQVHIASLSRFLERLQEMKRPVTPASSPPPPSPGATAGP